MVSCISDSKPSNYVKYFIDENSPTVTLMYDFFLFSQKRGESEFITKWKWRNTLTSFIHSTLTGLWAIFIFAADPSFAEDMINGFSTSGHMLISGKYTNIFGILNRITEFNYIATKCF